MRVPGPSLLSAVGERETFEGGRQEATRARNRRRRRQQPEHEAPVDEAPGGEGQGSRSRGDRLGYAANAEDRHQPWGRVPNARPRSSWTPRADVFLAKGYFGLRIDDIADATGTVRHMLPRVLPVEARPAARFGQQTFEATDQAPSTTSTRSRTAGHTARRYELVRIYLKMLEDHGAFILVWSQATYGDEELAAAGVLRTARDRAPARSSAPTTQDFPADADDDPAASAWRCW